MKINVGFIGLGDMGYPMARNLIRKRFNLTVHDIRPERCADFVGLGARMARSPKALAETCEIIEVCVFNDAQVEAVILGDDGILAAAKPDTIIAIHSTIRPKTVTKLAEVAARKGCQVIDAPVTGGAIAAQSKSLIYIVGGAPRLLEHCRPVFETSAKEIIHAGPLGSGMGIKLCNNLMTYMGFLTVKEATLLAKSGGLSTDVLRQVTLSNGVMTDRMDGFFRSQENAGDEGAEPSHQARLEWVSQLTQKDLAVTLEFAQDCGVSLPGTECCQQLIEWIYGLKDQWG